MEKRFQEKKDEVETIKKNLKQIDHLEAKVLNLEKSVNNQIPKELAKIESMQKSITENEKTLQNLKKSLDSSNQEIEKLNSKNGQTNLKIDLQSKIDNLGNKLEIKIESGLKKTTESQNCLNDWLTKLSQKSEENEILNENFKKSFKSNGQDLLVLKEKMSQIVSKSELQSFKKNVDEQNDRFLNFEKLMEDKCEDKSKR